MAGLENPGIKDKVCAECPEGNSRPVVKVVVVGSQRTPLCKYHLDPLLEDCAALSIELIG